MSASEWLKANAPPEVQAEIRANFQFALENGVQPMERIRAMIKEGRGPDLNALFFGEQTPDLTAKEVVKMVEHALGEHDRLNGLINNPHTAQFMEAVKTEAAHQRERWGTEHDAGKSPEEWLFLMGYLGTKACQAHGKFNRSSDPKHQEKALHHTISTAGACLNWHAAVAGEDTSMRPGIKPPKAKP